MISLLTILACVPSELTNTESVELYVLNSDGSILDARFSVGNTGLLKGQGHLNLNWIPSTGIQSPFKRSSIDPYLSNPSEPMQVSVGTDSLIQRDDYWEFNVSSGEFDLRIQLSDGHEGSGITSDNWSANAILVGATAAGSLRSRPSQAIVSGDAIVIRRGGDSPPALSGIGRESAYVFSSDFAIGIDQVAGDAIAWAYYQGQELVSSDAILSRLEGGFLLDFRPSSPLYVEVVTSTPHLASQPWQHLTYLERLAGGILFSSHVRRTRGGIARIYFQDDSYSGRAIINVVDSD